MIGQSRQHHGSTALLIAVTAQFVHLQQVAAADEKPFVLTGHLRTVTSVAFSADSARMASGSLDYSVRIWDPQRRECLRSIHGHDSAVHCVCFSADGQHLLSGTYSGTISKWDVATGKLILGKGSSDGTIRSVAYTSNPDVIVSLSDRHLKLVRAVDFSIIDDVTLSDSTAQLAVDGKTLAVTFMNSKNVEIYEIGDNLRYTTSIGGTETEWVASMSSHEKLLVTSGSASKIRQWSLATGEVVRTKPLVDPEGIRSISVSPNGALMAMTGQDQSVRVRLVKSGDREFASHLFSHGLGEVVSFSPDGHYLAVGGGYEPGELYLYDASCFGP